MVLADSDRISHVPPYSGYCYDGKCFRVRDYHPLWSYFPVSSTNIYFSIAQSYNPKIAETILVWAISTSLATTTEITLVFSSCAYLDVSVQRVRFHCWIIHLQCIRFPHSDICGSNRICQSPQLFAAYHVFLRLWEPRHSPCALSNLLITLSFLLNVDCSTFTTSINSNMSKNFCCYNTVNQYLIVLFCITIVTFHYPYAIFFLLWRITESNRWPPACKAGALASWANPPNLFKCFTSPMTLPTF